MGDKEVRKEDAEWRKRAGSEQGRETEVRKTSRRDERFEYYVVSWMVVIYDCQST